VPRFLPEALARHSDFTQYYREHIESLAASTGAFVDIGSLTKLKRDTIRNFGSEWHTWGRFGWGDAVTLAQTKRIFDYKVMFTPEELHGKRVLDAGCGNGRYSKIALDYGGEVFGVDLSDAVDVAQENLGSNQKMHIVQGDLFKLPFKKEVFDFAFSNGVLMHTGNARKAFLSLIPHLTDKGSITAHLYHRGNFIYEIIDGGLRIITTRLPLSLMYTLSKIGAKVASWIPRSFLDQVINAFVRWEPHPHYIFDWYTAPIATHHTYPEVYGWLSEGELYLEKDHNATLHPFIRRFIVPFYFLTVRASKQKPSHDPLHSRS
jgi:SAM-dependent methyltransferase